MNKNIIVLSASAGGLVGGYIPTLLFGVNDIGGWSVLGALIGGLLGIYFGYKIANI